jgi:type III secretion protein J
MRALLCVLVCAGCEAELASELDRAQADEIVLALDEAGIGAQKERDPTSGAYRVIVAREEVAPGLTVLRDHELPRERAPGVEALFGERGLVPSASEERARQAAVTAGELARSIEALDGVIHARVHLASIDRRGPLDAEPAPPTASVLIEHRPGARIDEDAVRALVAGAVPELEAARVTVVRTPRRAAPPREARLVMIGPVAVSRGSATALKVILAISFGLNIALAALVVLARSRRTRGAKAEHAITRAET